MNEADYQNKQNEALRDFVTRKGISLATISKLSGREALTTLKWWSGEYKFQLQDIEKIANKMEILSKQNSVFFSRIDAKEFSVFHSNEKKVSPMQHDIGSLNSYTLLSLDYVSLLILKPNIAESFLGDLDEIMSRKIIPTYGVQLAILWRFIQVSKLVLGILPRRIFQGLGLVKIIETLTNWFSK